MKRRTAHSLSAVWLLATVNTAVYAAAVLGADTSVHSLSQDTVWPQLITYMFTHSHMLHIATNIAIITIAGAWLERRVGPWITTATFMSGGIAGGTAFLAACTLWNTHDTTLEGASAAALAMCVAALGCSQQPLRRLRRSRFTTAAAIFSAFVVMHGIVGINPGGAIAHFGGILAGMASSIIYRRTNKVTTTGSDRYNQILSRARQSGYSSLTPAERQQLSDNITHP